MNTIEDLAKSNKMGVLGISEANISETDLDNQLIVDGYKTVVDKGRNGPHKMSRTAMLIRSDLSYKIREDLMGTKFPETWVEIGDPKTKKH